MDNMNLRSSSSYNNNKLGKLIKKSDLFKHLGVVAKILMVFSTCPCKWWNTIWKWPTIFSSPVLSS